MQLVGNQLPSMRSPLKGLGEGGGGRQNSGVCHSHCGNQVTRASHTGLGVTQLETR